MVESTERSASSGSLTVPLKAVAIATSVFGVACLVVLVIATAIDKANALATVALALAILAFTMQLIVFIAQDAGAREQGRRNEELHGLMRELLAEIKEKTAGTQADVRTINDKLLESLLAKSVTDAQGTPGGIDYRRLAAEVSSLLGERSPTPSPQAPAGRQTQNAPWPPRRPTPQDEQIRNELKAFPLPEEVGDSLEVLRSLPETAQSKLRLFGLDEIRNRDPDAVFDPALSDVYTDELAEHGLVAPIPGYFHSVDGSPLFHLTDRGRQVARLLTASGEIPDYLEGLEEIRNELLDEEAAS
jgi:hypothetical protein